jgi:signal transduction histidine kinase
MSPYLACLVIVVSVGVSVVWSDRRSLVSQASGLLTLVVAVWLCLYWRLRTPWGDGPVPWLRLIAAVADFLPWLMWWLGQCAISPHGSWRGFLSIGKYWAAPSVCLAAMALSPWFIPADSTAERHLFGPLFLPHQIGQLGLFLALPVYAVSAIARLQGFSRSLAKVLFLGGGLAALASIGIKLIAPLFGRVELAAVAPMVVTAFYVGAAWTIASQRLLDVRLRMLTALRRSIALVGAAFLIAWLIEQPWHLPRELHILIATTSGVMLALLFDSLASFLIERSLANDGLSAAADLQRFTTHIAALPVAELRENAATRIAETLSCQEVAVYWRTEISRPLRLVSAHGVPPECPDQLDDEHVVLRHSARHRGSWWLARHLPSIDPGLASFALCVPVVEQDHVLLLILAGHKSNAMGFSQPELAALQSWALACHHTLTTRALLERENAQQQLVYAGKLAAGIAHNIRNPLAIVRAYLEADPAIPRADLAELHDLALTESARIQSTIDGLTALARGERFNLAPHDLEALVRRATEVNAPYLAECRATVEIVGAPDTVQVLAEPWQLTTALTNLLRNSAEEVAREGGGWIRFAFGPAAPGWIELRVSDSGRGLPTHIRDAVFSRDLFAQTTKPTSAPGRPTGFGIGLHSTMLIVTIGHGGRFEYRDQAFVLTLPAAPSSAPRRE